MPTYEYRCPGGHHFEVFQRISEEPGALCPECGEAAQRQISAGAGFLFKGDGFYITDYRSADYRKKASSEGSPGSGGGSGESGTGSSSGAPPSGSSGTPGPATSGSGSDG